VSRKDLIGKVACQVLFFAIIEMEKT